MSLGGCVGKKFEKLFVEEEHYGEFAPQQELFDKYNI